MKTGG